MAQISPHPGPQTDFLSCPADIAIFGGAAGPGKLQPVTTDIITPYGIKKLININVGDAISNPDGSDGYVSHVHPIRDEDEYKITFHDYTSALCGPEHLWLAWRSGKRVKRGGKGIFGEQSATVIETTQLKKWCEKAIGQCERGVRPDWPLIPVCKEQYFGACEHFNFGIDPYAMGALLGNGCLRKSTLALDMHSDDVGHYRNVFKDYLFSEANKGGCGYRFCFNGDSRKDLLAIMRLYGLDNRRSYEKFIPDAFKWASINDRCSIIQGLLDTDGHVEKDGYVEYSSSSKQLADDVAFILRSLGSTVVITPKEPFYRDANGEKVYCHTSYRLYIKHPQPEKLFRIERKKSVLVGLKQQLNMYRRVVSVEKTGKKVPMRCITVSNPNGLYMCNDFIVTHNSFCLLLDPLRNIADPAFNGVTFRRTSKQVTIGGGLWDTSVNLYRSQGSIPIEGKLTHRFPSGAKIAFSHLEHAKNRFDHQGAQYPFIGFDELTHFEKNMFWYLVTRSRRPDNYVGPCYVRATTNPTDKDDPIGGWVRDLIDWWIDPDTGYAIKERSGVIRYMTVQDDKVIWVPEDWRDEDGQPPKSFTFIAASLDDNPSADPSYKSTLSAQDSVTKERLLNGNWNISYKGGMFNPAWFKVVDQVPDGIKWLRYWDFAASEVKPGKNPDWTAGAKVGFYGADMYISDVEHFRCTPAVTETKVRLCADRDGKQVEVAMEEEKGSAGKFVTMHFKKNVLPDRVVYADTPTGEKTERARPWCALAENGHVFLVRGQWNQTFLSEAGAFPLGKRDIIDSTSGAYKILTAGNRVFKDYRGDTSNFVIGWDNLDIGTRLIISQWTDSAQNTGILFMIWTAKTGRLIVFDEFLFGSSAPERLISSLIASIRKTTNNVYRNLQGWEWYANDEMFSKTGSGDMRSAYRKYRINLRKNNQYDENGSILYGQRILERSKLLIHDNCQNFSRQMSSWVMSDTKPEGGNILARAFCNVVSILWEQGKIEPALKKLKPYSYQSTAYFQDVERRAKEGKLYNDGVPLPPERPPSIVGDRTQVDGWFRN